MDDERQVSGQAADPGGPQPESEHPRSGDDFLAPPDEEDPTREKPTRPGAGPGGLGVPPPPD